MKKRMKAAGGQHHFLNGEATAKYWADTEVTAVPLVKTVLEK